MGYTLDEKFNLIEKKLLGSKEVDAIKLAKEIMKEDYVYIHGPEHHFLDGGVLLVLIKNAGIEFDLEKALKELKNRTFNMPGAMCGYWGICGSTASSGAVFSILDGTGPLSNDNNYADHMEFTSKVINNMSKIGGPRCCKRNAFISIYEGIIYANQKYHLNLPHTKIICDFSSLNGQCIKERYPFNLPNN